MSTYFTIGFVLFIINILLAFCCEKTPDGFWARILVAVFCFIAWPLVILVNILGYLYFKIFPQQKILYEEMKKNKY